MITSAQDKRALQQLALNVHVQPSIVKLERFLNGVTVDGICFHKPIITIGRQPVSLSSRRVDQVEKEKKRAGHDG